MAISFYNIGGIYRYRGDLTKAIEYYNRSLKLGEELKDKDAMTNPLNNIAEALLQQGKTDKALEFGLKGLKIAKELGYPNNIKTIAKTLKKIYEKQNKSKEAYEMYDLHIRMRDSINNEETKKASVRSELKYEYEKKAAADSVKNAEEQKIKNAQLSAQHAQLKQEKTQRYALYGGLVLIIAFLAFVFNRFRITQRQKVIIEKQKQDVDHAYEKLHEKNQEVMDSIYYARRIQRALVTSEKYIAKHLNKLIER